MTELYDERQARKAYMRRRQRKVFGIAGTLLVVVLVIALMFYYHAFGLGESKQAATLPNYGVTAPCAPTDSKGNPVKYLDNRDVSIRVLNGTTFGGLAGAVADELQNNRAFPDVKAETYLDAKGNQIQDVERTTIRFGKNAIAQGYTVAANFTDAVMVMDDRDDLLVDVVLGGTFNDLVDRDKVPGSGTEITSIEGCVAADKMTNLPKAITHDPVKAS
ncbi:LytR cell envelope-related transcriptional attenuator [Bifidobacterium ramosum]|uniref:LytR cell envelope-related transcriptional attenuator n=1 Tax=Bifidobacterium ramosum TaxID=1798158 RepID=A0A6L4WYY4_9BIFI|nr:LytR C-terminal domain-containing protein [Bifidobacterium ramosum]KAB8287303.1 LytR cell envelope-related transcriptional attenuator [Bifidobacterium ramosum]NEG72427.1 LytR family transcriptional regulator [Bifidobacterium ramosum]